MENADAPATQSYPPGEEENPYWMSFSDIMSGLLVIFILASTDLDAATDGDEG